MIASTGTKMVGIWLRVSTEMQAETDSLEHHELRAKAYAESKGWKVLEVYNLSGVSGKTVIDHPETKRMLADVQAGKISALIFSKLARLARNTRELLDIADIFQQNNAGLVSLQESIDTTTAGGRLFFTMLAATTQFERDEIASRVAASVPIRAKLGKPLGGQSPFGYRWKDKKLVPDEQEAPIRRQIYELFDLHKRKKKVATILNEKGYRTRGGAKFSDTSIDRLLRDTTAKGVHRRNYAKTRGKGQQWDLKDPSEWVFNEVEPIVSEALWASCNTYLDEQRAKLRAARGRSSKHLFAGIMRCSCGMKMYTYKSDSSYRCKDCKNKIPIKVIEDIYETQLREFLTSRVDLDDAAEKTREYIASKASELESLSVSHKKAVAEMEKYERLFLDDGIDARRFKELHSPISLQANQLKTNIKELSVELESLKKSSFSNEAVIEKSTNLAQKWKKLSRENKRHLVESITEEITIGQDSIDISFTYVPLVNETTRQHTNMVVLPCFLQFKKRIPKPLSALYPKKLETIGDHLRKVRLDRSLLQRELAKELAVCPTTIKNWEKGYKIPLDSHLPIICRFLGYCPIVEKSPEHFGHKLNLYRRYMRGQSLEDCASEIGIDPATLSMIESDNTIRFKRVEKNIHLFLKNSCFLTKNERFWPRRVLRSEGK